MELDRPLPLPEAQLDAAAGEEVERRDPLGDADRMVRRELDDAMAEPNALGPLAGGPEEDLRRGGVGILLEEVVLDHPGVVVAEPVRELNLGERVLEDLVLAPLRPGPRDLMLVEDAEPHPRAPLNARAAIAACWRTA